MKKYRVKLKFRTPLHVGEKDNIYNAVSKFVHSDTIFSGLVNAYNILFGGEKTEKFLNVIIEDPDIFRISSSFFYYKDIYFYPKPFGYNFGLDKFYLDDMKKIRKLEFVSEEFLKGNVENPVIFGKFATNGKNVEEFVHVRDVPRIVNDRITNEVSIFYMSYVTFDKDSGLWFFLDVDESLENEVFASLKLLGDEGIGGERTYGYGAFEFDVEEVDLKSEGKMFLLLSSYYPKDQSEVRKVIYYKIYEKTGYVFSLYDNTKRQPIVRLFSEGSVFSDKVVGKILDITPKGFKYHRVYKYARAYLIPIEKEALK
ncbi:CRISPR-associated protein Csm4 [Thermosipho sp. 1063]|uniref:type III-A CRISPR-associated RAMP protein Csm4 n=1 Tax=unclassified Thermosipho (in: thermotogales) TaxID=2676525 RepID=UPI0009492E0F|nr:MULTISPECIES: type III-A CRISPR-associated RAMP protein Csm4 [unclassified Thermosipho (in: thermotogales)]ANQ53038.1 CRISPR-associated protein Csm4 [Thermosipho sp. 1070]APT71486.1 CRISPR-associated protein Csm4 [Thermosipho sp. 1063]OOC45561.1 CRISPR-associated protein Csm4 [Thermosipho sp. 1074]